MGQREGPWSRLQGRDKVVVMCRVGEGWLGTVIAVY